MTQFWCGFIWGVIGTHLGWALLFAAAFLCLVVKKARASR
jgi:hypothetical protein